MKFLKNKYSAEVYLLVLSNFIALFYLVYLISKIT
ncbi:putative membrane protein [Erwinia amylovora LA635]|nr:putative membrane protein [Erwinia amylovora LA635]CDK17053.1 hypothetical protein LA636_0060 [Erwinia amylovora LA636]CDK20422.1 putative membrane protein [Erwinia amylovora LA637]